MTTMRLTDRQKRGYAYEQQVRNHLAIQPDVNQAWLWRMCPERELETAGIIYDFDQQRIKRRKLWDLNENNIPDTGTDIVVKKADSYQLVQAKNYSSRKVYQEDLAGFYRHVLIYNLPGQVYSNSEYHSSVLEAPPTFDRITFKRFEYIPPGEHDQSSDNQLQLRDYQIDAVQSINSHLTRSDRAILALPCGAGKTLIAARIASDYDIIVVFSPLCAHAYQNLTRFSDILSSHTSRLINHEGCRDVDELKTFIRSHTKILLSCTLDSADILVQLLNTFSESGRATLMIVDEFHNISGAQLTDKEEPMNIVLRSQHKILSLSATPRQYLVENTDLDNDFQQYFGDYRVYMPLREAIARKIVTDYRVFIPLLNEIGDEDKCIRELQIADVDSSLLAKAMFLVKCMLYEGARKVIVYLANIAEVTAFYTVLVSVAREYFGLRDEFWASCITSEDGSQLRRQQTLQHFENFDGFAALLSIRILDEAIDIPATDSVFIATKMRSKIKAVQRICRANRLDRNNPDKVAKIFLWADAHTDLTDVISAIKEVDPEFPTKISSVSRKYGKRNVIVEQQEQIQTTSAVEYSVGVQEYLGNNHNRAVANAKAYVRWYTDHGGRHARQHQGNADELKQAQWLANYKNHSNTVARPEVDAILEEATGWRQLRQEAAKIAKIQQIREHIEKHDAVPSGGDLSSWLSRQRNLLLGPEASESNNTAPCIEQLDEEFGEVWRNHTDFNETVKAAGVIRRIINNYDRKRPPTKRGNGQASFDNNFINSYAAGMRGKKELKKLSLKAIKMFYDQVPGILPLPSECVAKYKV